MDSFTCLVYIFGAVSAAVGFSFLRTYLRGGQFTKDIRIDGKVIILTGCNSGIGKETALELARRGARLYMACRNYSKCEEVRRQIIDLSGNKNVFNVTVDLTSMESIRNFVKEFLKKETALDILINNAGILGVPRTITKEGHELIMASNHIGHFLLTNLLLDTLKSSAPSRIITLSSNMHPFGKIVKDNLHGEKKYSALQMYCNSKLANILFSRALASRLKGSGVTSNAVHPGIIRTEIGKNIPFLYGLVTVIFYLFSKSRKSGAQTTIACAIDPEFKDVTGRYFADCKVSNESKNAKDDEMAEWLWRTSEKLTGLVS